MRAANRTRASLRRPALVTGLALALALGTSACTTFDDVDWDIGDELGGTSVAPTDEVVVEPTAGSVDLVVGQTLVVDFGDINASVGDAWVLTQDPADAVLGAGEAETEYLGEADETGGRNTLVYTFEATGAGESVLELEYEFRGEAPESGQGPDPSEVTLTVSVTDG
jgi:hypothetical protein